MATAAVEYQESVARKEEEDRLLVRVFDTKFVFLNVFGLESSSTKIYAGLNALRNTISHTHYSTYRLYMSCAAREIQTRKTVGTEP